MFPCLLGHRRFNEFSRFARHLIGQGSHPGFEFCRIMHLYLSDLYHNQAIWTVRLFSCIIVNSTTDHTAFVPSAEAHAPHLCICLWLIILHLLVVIQSSFTFKCMSSLGANHQNLLRVPFYRWKWLDGIPFQKDYLAILPWGKSHKEKLSFDYSAWLSL